MIMSEPRIVAIGASAGGVGALRAIADGLPIDLPAAVDLRPGKLSTFTCPECHGPLWELDEGDLIRYRCRWPGRRQR
jgi:hypothetical protein